MSALVSDLTAPVQHLGCPWLLLNRKVVLKKPQEGAEYPLNNVGLGHPEHFAGLGLLGFNFGGRRSKPWHEGGGCGAGGEEPGAGRRGYLSQDPRALCWRSLWGLMGGKARAWEELLKPKSVKWKACVARTCQPSRSWLIKHCICLHKPAGGMMPA